MEFLETLCGIVVIILVFYYYLTSTFDFWKSRGIPGPQPIALFGTIKDVVLSKKALCDYFMEICNIYKDEPLIGIFVKRTPILIVKDPDLIKDILVKDFSSFSDRGFTVHEKADPLSQHIIALELKRWKLFRTKLSPVFTTGKLKGMFSLLLECTEHLERYIETLASRNEPIECRNLSAKYATDVVCQCIFGIDTSSMSDVEEFLRMGQEAFNPKLFDLIRFQTKQNAPWLFDILGRILPKTKVTKFFTQIVMDNIDYRERNNIVKHDFIDVLRTLKRHQNEIDIEINDGMIVSQAFIFYLAGFESTSSTMANALYELALNHKIQDTLREEINRTCANYGKTLIYDSIKQMDYLDKVFKETLRKYPPATFLMRRSTSNYTFNGTKINIPKGIHVRIPVYAIQRDPNIYPDPNVFDPERFNEEVVQTRDPMLYLPFGGGPRNCIGSRFAINQTKAGLITILRNYKIEVSEKTQIPLKNDPDAFLLTPTNGVYLKLRRINSV